MSLDPERGQGQEAHPSRLEQPEIADSDDEFDMRFDNSDLDDFSDKRRPLAKTDKETCLEMRQKTPTLQRAPKAQDSGPVARQTGVTSPSCSRNPVEGRAIATPAQSDQPASFSTLPSCQVKKDQNLMKILALPSEVLDRRLRTLEQVREKNADVAYEKAMIEEPADELVDENKKLEPLVEGLQSLKRQRAAHDSCSAKIGSLKKDITSALSRGEGLSTKSAELKQSRVLASELQSIETQMSELLSQKGLLEEVASSISSPQSSQAEPPRLPPPYPREEQTRGSSSRAESPEVDKFDDDDLIMGDDQEVFTRNMGSATLPGDAADEFDLDADDEALLEVAEQMDTAYPLLGVGDVPGEDGVLGGVSGSAPRLPPPEKSSADNAEWNHAWSNDVRAALRDRFHLQSFRSNQLEAINATLSGKNAFLLMPTGGGKSLCYQLPSIITSGSTRGVTIVVSPLLSLMQDQVLHMRRLGINASLLNGDTPLQERQALMNGLSSSQADPVDLLYITPEMINKSKRLNRVLYGLHSRRKLARIVIDEAHCVSQWGHDFRPDYKQLGDTISQFHGVPTMALTATATENVKMDVIHNLRIDGCQTISQSFNRSNLTYTVIQKKGVQNVMKSIAETISTKYRNQSGIVYCLSRRECEKVAKDLKDLYKIKAAHYHAGMTILQRQRVQQLWQAGKCHVIVATVAFGMGIDKADVRFVIHHSLPKSLEGYYQETGRAGRDGRPSGCYLYYGYRDAALMKRMIDVGEGSEEQKIKLRHMLRIAVQFCENRSDCRRVQILAYFNEFFRREDCKSSCDNCKSDSVFELRDYSEYAASAVALVKHVQYVLKESMTMLYCVDIFRGFKGKAEYKELPWFGKGSQFDKGETERLFCHLITEEALREENVVNKRNGFTHQYIKIGRKANEFERGLRRLELQVRVSPNAKNGAGAKRPAGDELPQSTNVSSPIQSAKRRPLDSFRYDGSDDEYSSDAVEPVRAANNPCRESKCIPVPAITGDENLENLDPLHSMVVEDFMTYAKEECEMVSNPFLSTELFLQEPLTLGR